MKAVERRLRDENRAIYLPAISETFARGIYRTPEAEVGRLRLRELNFLDPTTPLLYHPYALYSAGPAAPKSDAAPTRDIVSQRNREETVVLGDSGGFQIQSDKIKFEAETTPRRMLRWMEAIADYSMVLDFPTGGAGGVPALRHEARLKGEGHDLDALNRANRLGVGYNAYLLQTTLNNNFFVAERRAGATKLLNVLQGRSEKESRYWYEQVRDYPFEGWAFAGRHQNDFSLLVARLLDMRDDGLLGKCQWLHVLGVATPPIGVLLTQVQRAVRRLGFEDFQISFDAASPFTAAANMSIAASRTLNGAGWAIQNKLATELTDREETLNDALADDVGDVADREPLASAAGARVSLSNLLVPDPTRASGVRVSTSGSYVLMNHNTQAYLLAHDAAHDLMFEQEPLVFDPRLVPLPVKTIAAMIKLLFEGNLSACDRLEQIKSWKLWLSALRS